MILFHVKNVAIVLIIGRIPTQRMNALEKINLVMNLLNLKEWGIKQFTQLSVNLKPSESREKMEKLQSATDCKLMSFNECVKELGWNLEDDGDYFKVTCDCGDSHIVYSGFIGTEVIECQGCGKRMTDLFSPIQTGNATCTVLKPSEYEIEKDENGNDRYWIAKNKDGLALKESEE